MEDRMEDRWWRWSWELDLPKLALVPPRERRDPSLDDIDRYRVDEEGRFILYGPVRMRT